MHRIVLFLIFFGLLSATSSFADKITVFVSIVPQKTFVEAIAGDRVSVEVMVSPGASPATYEPRPRQMTALSGAQAYFTIGVPFERTWMQRFTAVNPEMRIVHTESGIERLPMAAHVHREHEGHGNSEHGHGEDEHEAEILDPHIWLAPPLVKTQARTIMEGLSTLDPAHADRYLAGYESFTADIDDLDRLLREILRPVRGKPFMVFHPSWGYFANTYGLKQIPIEIQGKEPSPRELAHIIQEAEEEAITTIFVQPQFSHSSAAAIARSINGKVVTADPLAPDWMDNLLAAARAFREAAR